MWHKISIPHQTYFFLRTVARCHQASILIIMNGGVNMSDNSNKDRTVFVSEIKWTLWDRITMPFYRARNFFRNKWWGFRKRCQRFKRGFAWSDVWDMDAWFISTTKPMLEHFLEKHCAYPCNIENEEWEAILKEMIDCLELMEEKKDRFFELFSKWFFNLWD